MKTQKISILLSLLVPLGLVLAACQPQVVEVVKEVPVVEKEVEVVEVEVVKVVEKIVEVEESASGPVDLSMWYFNWPQGYEYQEERVRLYMNENPNVTVDFDHSVPPVGEGGF